MFYFWRLYLPNPSAMLRMWNQVIFKWGTTVISLQNGLLYLNNKLPRHKKKGKLWTYTYQKNSKAQLDYMLVHAGKICLF